MVIDQSRKVKIKAPMHLLESDLRLRCKRVKQRFARLIYNCSEGENRMLNTLTFSSGKQKSINNAHLDRYTIDALEMVNILAYSINYFFLKKKSFVYIDSLTKSFFFNS